jgi:hypothetical protein
VIQAFQSTHRLIDTPEGPTPAGGFSTIRVGTDASGDGGSSAAWVSWQNGPLGPPGHPERAEPDGAPLDERAARSAARRNVSREART